LKKEDRKDEVTKVNEEERRRSSLYPSFLSIIFLPFSLRPLYPSLYIHSFLPSSSYLSVVPSST
jgi:hypothetical protein